MNQTTQELGSTHPLVRTEEEARFLETYDTLTPREKEILDYIANGQSYYEIAKAMSVTSLTVRNHVSNIKSKFINLYRKIYNSRPENTAEVASIKLKRNISVASIAILYIRFVMPRKTIRGPYRKSTDRPRPDLPANAEENREKKKVTLRFSEAVIEAVDARVAALRLKGISVDRNQWITEAIQLRLDM